VFLVLFNSYSFIFIFFPVVFSVFYISTNAKMSILRKYVLVLSSLVFYGQWNLSNLWVLLFSIVVNYGISKNIRNEQEELVSNLSLVWLTVGIIINIAVLVYYKYLNFIASTVTSIFGWSFVPWDVALPLGISFFTFQQIIYHVDLYRGVTRPANIFDYAVCVTFFPHLIAGPIIKYSKLFPQLQDSSQFRVHSRYVAAGVGYFVIGLMKKVLLADNLSPLADKAFSISLQHLPLSSPDAWAGALAYTLQLYFDFSGYSDMAIGLGLFFGIELPLNFNSPYKAVSIVDFWRRWHMTLSYFLRDYLYIPLGGNRRGPGRRYLNLMLTMLIGGFWHGAGWTFIVWGVMHGMGLCLTHWSKTWLVESSQLRRFLAIPGVCRGLTLLFLIFAWVVFRAENLDSALYIWRAMVGQGDGWSLSAPWLKVVWLVPSLIIALFMPNCQQIMCNFRSLFEYYSSPKLSSLYFRPTAVWGAVVAAGLFSSVLLLSKNTKFLYFDF
jgi:D-alanyl-lipoteichoic acid acyltransferase DltB (MBOAT superfamily)